MYVIPFSMGPIGSRLSKIGIQLTDSPYVVASMRIMTRIGKDVLDCLGDNDFVKCLHSVGQPLPMITKPVNNWPCNPEKTIIAHSPDKNEISSFGSGYIFVLLWQGLLMYLIQVTEVTLCWAKNVSLFDWAQLLPNEKVGWQNIC